MNKKGLTLIEVLVVIAIIAILIVLGLGVYRIHINRGNDARRKADLNKIKMVVEEYEKDFDCYPTTLPACGSDLSSPFISYTNRLPCDPVSNQDYYYYPEQNTACPQWYWLFAAFDNPEDESSQYLGCGRGCGPTEEQASDYDYYDSSPNAPDPFIATTIQWGCIGGACAEVLCDPDGTNCECSPTYGSQSHCHERCEVDHTAPECI